MKLFSPLKSLGRDLRLVVKTLKHSRTHRDDIGIFFDGVTYFADGFGTVHNSDALREPRFARAYELGNSTGSWRGVSNQWRVHTALWAASAAKRLEGDFVECGVYRGGVARAIVDYLDFGRLNRQYHLFDTFRGLDPAQISAEERTSADRAEVYEDSLEAVRATFAPFANVKIWPGSVPDSLPAAQIAKVAFLHLDMNCAAPEVAAAQYFWPKLVPGAVVLLDDYAYRGYLPQKRAMDAFAEEKGIRILTLPTGQGLWLR